MTDDANTVNFFSDRVTEQVRAETLKQSLYVAALSRGLGNQVKIWKPARVTAADKVIRSLTQKTKPAAINRNLLRNQRKTEDD